MLIKYQASDSTVWNVINVVKVELPPKELLCHFLTFNTVRMCKTWATV